MKIYLSFLLLLLCKLSFGQTQITSTILDKQSNQNINGAHVQIVDSNQGVYTDANGQFTIELPSLPSTLKISHIGYETQFINISKSQDLAEVIYLTSNNNIISEITITAEQDIEVLTDIKSFSASDFEILDGKLFLLEYHGSFKKYALTILDKDGNRIEKVKLKNIKRVQKLQIGWGSTLFLVTNYKAYPIYEYAESMRYDAPVDIDTFDRFITPCKFKIDNDYYFITSKYNGLAKIISKYNIKNQEQQLIKIIANEEQLKYYQEDLQTIIESQTTGNGDVSTRAQNEKIRNLQEDGDFLKSVFYNPEFDLDLFSHNNQVVLFNHIQQKIEIFSDLDKVEEIPIEYPHSKKWLKRILYDEKAKIFYTTFKLKKGIGLHKIDLSTGKTELIAIVETERFNHKTIKVYDDSVFYLKENLKRKPLKELCKMAL